MNNEQEERHLAEAERDIANAREMIRFQQIRIERMRAQGTPTQESEEMLTTMLVSLALMQQHRDLILAKLGDLEQFQ